MTRLRSLRARTSRGSAFVEGALVLTIVIFILIGIVDVGQVLVMHQGLVERVRAGARYAVVNTYNVNNIKNVVRFNSPSPGDGAKPLFGLQASQISVTLLNANTPEARVEVRITNYPFRFFTPLIKGVYSARPIFVSIPVEGLGATS